MIVGEGSGKLIIAKLLIAERIKVDIMLLISLNFLPPSNTDNLD